MAMPLPDTSVKPTASWYLLTLGIGLAGLVVAGFLLTGGVKEARGIGSEATFIEIGTDSTITADHPQSFTLYYAGPEQVQTQSEVPDLVDRLGIRLVDAAGREVEMQPYEGSAGISRGGRVAAQQVALTTFRLEEEGDYTFSSTRLADVGQFDAQLVVSPSPFRPLARRAWQALGAVVGFGIASIIATVALAVTRRRNRVAARMSYRPSYTTASRGGPAAMGWSGGAPIIPPPPPGYGPEPPRHP